MSSWFTSKFQQQQQQVKETQQTLFKEATSQQALIIALRKSALQWAEFRRQGDELMEKTLALAGQLEQSLPQASRTLASPGANSEFLKGPEYLNSMSQEQRMGAKAHELFNEPPPPNPNFSGPSHANQAPFAGASTTPDWISAQTNNSLPSFQTPASKSTQVSQAASMPRIRIAWAKGNDLYDIDAVIRDKLKLLLSVTLGTAVDYEEVGSAAALISTNASLRFLFWRSSDRVQDTLKVIATHHVPMDIDTAPAVIVIMCHPRKRPVAFGSEHREFLGTKLKTQWKVVDVTFSDGHPSPALHDQDWTKAVTTITSLEMATFK